LQSNVAKIHISCSNIVENTKLV